MIEKQHEDLLKRLSEANGISGHENEIAKIVISELHNAGIKDIEVDNLGNILATYHCDIKDAPTVMIAAHMDEVGFIVKSICPNGMLRIHPVGGWYNHTILAQDFIVKTRSGKEYYAVTGAEPPHGMSAEQRSKLLPISEMYLDLGVKDKKMVEDMGILPGDTVTPYQQYRVMADGETLLGKAWDDRLGLACCIETMKYIALNGANCNVVFAATVQEEVGCRGAITAAHYVDPDIAFAVDVSTSNDLPHSPTDACVLGAGPALSIMDGGTIAHPGLLNFVENIANEFNIKHCYDMETAGGTDASKIHLSQDGVIAMTISIPCRYYHSHVSMINYYDFINTSKLLIATIANINTDTLLALQESKIK